MGGALQQSPGHGTHLTDGEQLGVAGDGGIRASMGSCEGVVLRGSTIRRGCSGRWFLHPEREQSLQISHAPQGEHLFRCQHQAVAGLHRRCDRHASKRIPGITGRRGGRRVDAVRRQPQSCGDQAEKFAIPGRLIGFAGESRGER